MATRPIDEKIVAMKMDNSDFVQKASDTTKLMGRFTDMLNKIPGINIGKTVKDFDNVNKSMNGINTNGLMSAIDTVTSRFSAMGIVGTTALVNIANRAVDAGLAMVKNMTVAPVMDGFHEYETEMGSIQTILANTAKYGTNVDDVTKALGELNKYADKTIYSFSDMTRNIGLFTNAGLGLKESTSMIEGFSNAAAAAGVDANRAAGAAFQLSQGLSSGYLMQMDWMSLTTAGMGNDNMKRDLIALGHAMGTLNTSTEYTLTNWKDLLSDRKWLTKDVMSKYLQAMAGDLSDVQLQTLGLSKAQAELLLQNAKMGEDSATKVRTFTQMIGTITESIGSGWADTWKIIFGGFEDATKLWSGFTDIISAPFNALSKSRNNFLQSLKDKGVFVDLFTSLGTAIYVVGQAVTAVTGGFDKAFAPDKVGMVSSLVTGFGKLVSALTPSQASLAKMSTIFQALGSDVRVVMAILGQVGKLFLKLIPDNLGSTILNILETLAKMNLTLTDSILKGNGISKAFKGLGDVFTWIKGRLTDLLGGLSKLTSSISDIWTVLVTGQQSADSSFGKESKMVVWMAAIGSAVRATAAWLGDLNVSLKPVRSAFDTFFSAIATGFNWFKNTLVAIGGVIKDNMPSGTTLLAGGFVAALVTITGIVIKRINDISKIFGGFGKSIDAFAETLDSVGGALDSFALNLKANALLTASIAVGALALSVLMLSRVDGSKVASSLGAIVGSLTAVIGAITVMDKFNVTGGFRVTTTIIGMAVALSVMSLALRTFASMNPAELTKGLIGVSTVMFALAGSFALMGKTSSTNISTSAAQIVAMSISILIIAQAVKKMSDMKPSELARGIGGIAALLLAISGAFALMGKTGGKSSGTALQFVAMAGSVMMLVVAIKMISSIKTDDLLIGLGTITLILAAVAGFAKFTSGTGLLASAAGLLAISVAMNALLIPILTLGLFPLDKLGVGLLGMTVALLAIAAASTVMKNAITGAVSITAMAIALNLLLIPIGVFAAMGWGPMLTGIAGLGLALGVLAGVALLLAPGAVPLLAFGAAIALMGVAMMAAGAGLTLFSAGLVALAGMTSAAVATIVTTIGALIVGLASLIPSAVKFAIEIITKVAEAIRDNAPKILGIILDTIVNILETIATYIPKFVKAAVDIITALIDGIAAEAPKLINSYVNLIITLVETMAKTVEENGPRFINAFLDLFKQVLTFMVQAGTSVMKAMFGWIPGVNKTLDKVGKTATDAINKSFDSAKIAENKGDDFAKGLNAKQGDVKLASVELSNAANSGLETADSKKSGGNFVTNFISGLFGKKKDVKDAASQLADAAVDGTNETLDVNSPGEEGRYSGEMHGVGVAQGVDSTTPLVKKSAENMSKGLLSGMGDTYSQVKDKLFIKDSDVKDNEKRVGQVVDNYTTANDHLGKGKKTGTGSKGAKNELDKAFVAFKDWLDDRKFYNQITTQQELDAWQKEQVKYKEGTEERKEADRAVYTLKKQLITEASDAEKAAFDKSKSYIDDRKFYNKMSTADELAAWQKLQKQYKKGTDERKEADRQVYTLQKELNQKAIDDKKAALEKIKQAEQDAFDASKKFMQDETDIKHISLAEELSDWERIQKKYKVGTAEREEADREVLRVKTEINDKLKELNDDYLQKVKDTNDKLLADEKQLNDDYKRTFDDRVKTISGFVGLFDDVAKPDPDKPVTGTQLLTNLQDQTDTLATWSDDLKRLSDKGIDQGLLKELEEMGPSAANEIAALNQLTSAQLDQYVELWQKKTALATTAATTELAPLREETNKNIENLKKDAATALKGYEEEWAKSVAAIRVNTNTEMVGMTTDMKTIGGYAIDGLKKGISDKTGPLYDQIKSLADGMIKTIKDTLQIKSPSRVMMGLGAFAGAGLAEGISNSAKKVSDTSKNLALTAVDSVNKFINSFQQPSFDNEIHLKAVLDDSDINNKLSNFNSASLLKLGTTNGLVSAAKTDLRQNGNNVPTTDTSKPSTPDATSKSDSNRPIIIQSVLNGRIIAEETFDDMNQLMGNRTNLDFLMRGV